MNTPAASAAAVNANEHWCAPITISGGNVTALGGSELVSMLPPSAMNAGQPDAKPSPSRAVSSALTQPARPRSSPSAWRRQTAPDRIRHVAVDISGGIHHCQRGQQSERLRLHGNGYNTQKDKYFAVTITEVLYPHCPTACSSNQPEVMFQVDPTDASIIRFPQ